MSLESGRKQAPIPGKNFPFDQEFPVTFTVCVQHKKEFFLDYDDANAGKKTDCILCNPIDNDSLGG